MDPITLLAIAGVGIAAFSVLRTQEAKAATIPMPSSTPPAPKATGINAVLAGVTIAAITQTFTAVQAAGTDVKVWEAEALRLISEGHLDSFFLQTSDINVVRREISVRVGPSPAQWFTSDPWPTVWATAKARIIALSTGQMS